LGPFEVRIAELEREVALLRAVYEAAKDYARPGRYRTWAAVNAMKAYDKERA